MSERGESAQKGVALYSEALMTGSLPRESAVQALTDLLSDIDWVAEQAEPRTLLHLCLLLMTSDARVDSVLMLSLLGALERNGDPGAADYVRPIAESWAVWKLARPVRKQARRCLAALEREGDRRTAAETLLRGSELPPESMVRPAESAVRECMLVRPAT